MLFNVKGNGRMVYIFIDLQKTNSIYLLIRKSEIR